MPQIDFGQAFSDLDKPVSSPWCGEAWPARESPVRDAGVGSTELSTSRRSRLGRSGWTNIFFTIIALWGGLFCAFYFFNGAELLRSALSWPREYLYMQPRAGDGSDADRLRLAASLGIAALGEAKLPGANSGDPFSPTKDFISLNPPTPRSARSDSGGRLASGFVNTFGGLPGGSPDAGSVLSRLGLPAPGGDALMQAFNSAVVNLQRMTRLNVQRTVVVVQTAVTGIEKHANSRAKNTGRGTQTHANNLFGQTNSQIGNAQPTAGPATSTQQALSSARGGFSGLGGGLSGIRGGLSGGVGGLGGSLGSHAGLGGGRGH